MKICEYENIQCCSCKSEELEEVTHNYPRLKKELLHVLQCKKCLMIFSIPCVD